MENHSGKSSLIQFIEKYRRTQMSNTKLRQLWKSEIDQEDFDGNEAEVYLWYQNYRKSSVK